MSCARKRLDVVKHAARKRCGKGRSESIAGAVRQAPFPGIEPFPAALALRSDSLRRILSQTFHVEHPKQYTGERTSNGAVVAVVDLKTHEGRPLPVGLQHVRHSPTGFEWGYLGSGPAQLAFAILLDHFGDPAPARVYYQTFKREVIATFQFERWELSTDQIAEVITKIQARFAREESA